jgi:hypothetical protein
MAESKPPEENLESEFRTLGKNLVEALRTAWESPERKKLQHEIESGLIEFGNTLKEEVDNFSETPKGQKLKAEVEDVRERIQKGQVEAKAREEILSVLRVANTELTKIIQRWGDAQQGSEKTDESNPQRNPPGPSKEA